MLKVYSSTCARSLRAPSACRRATSNRTDDAAATGWTSKDTEGLNKAAALPTPWRVREAWPRAVGLAVEGLARAVDLTRSSGGGKRGARGGAWCEAWL